MDNVLTFKAIPNTPLGHRIMLWNRKGNSLNFDIDLEIKMLSEEANKFFMVDTLVERLDAYTDFQFVAAGTAFKYFASKFEEYDTFYSTQGEMDQLILWIDNVQTQMRHLLLTEMSLIRKTLAFDEELQDELFTKALEIVTDANEQKVLKPAILIKPEAKLDALLKAKLGEKYVSQYN